MQSKRVMFLKCAHRLGFGSPKLTPPQRSSSRLVLAAAVCLSVGARLASGAELTISGTTLSPGGGGTISVAYASQGSQVSGLQFDFGYDPSSLNINPIAASSIRSAGKSRYYADQSSTAHRLIVVGLNQSSLNDGPVFTLFVNVSPNAAPGAYSVSLANVVGVDSSGNVVPVSFGAGMVTVSGKLGDSPAIQSSGVLNGGSLISGSVSPGEVVTLIGSAIGPAAPLTLQLASPDTVSTTLNNTQVTFDGTPAPLLYAGLNQINAVVPFEVSGQTTAMTISQNGQLIGPVTIPVAAATPAILTLDASGTGAAFAENFPNFSLNSIQNPAPAGSVVILILLGVGQSTPVQLTGSIDADIGNTNLPVTAAVGGLPANIIYAGPAPGLIAGATQVNLQIPSSVAPSLVVPVSFQVGNIATQAGVVISVSAAH